MSTQTAAGDTLLTSTPRGQTHSLHVRRPRVGTDATIACRPLASSWVGGLSRSGGEKQQRIRCAYHWLGRTPVSGRGRGGLRVARRSAPRAGESRPRTALIARRGAPDACKPGAPRWGGEKFRSENRGTGARTKPGAAMWSGASWWTRAGLSAAGGPIGRVRQRTGVEVPG